MGEKRKPVLVILLKKQGKSGNNLKVELFDAALWPNRETWKGKRGRRFRIRANGKWFDSTNDCRAFWTIWEIRDLFWRTVKQLVF